MAIPDTEEFDANIDIGVEENVGLATPSCPCVFEPQHFRPPFAMAQAQSTVAEVSEATMTRLMPVV